MELAHLVRPVNGSIRARAFAVGKILAGFFAIGLALFGVRRALAPGTVTRHALVVHVDASSRDAEIARAIDDAILVDLATRAGWARSDAVVRERIRKSLEAVEDVSDAERTIERGLAMDLPRTDPVARARLVSVARASVAQRAPERAIDDVEIAAFIDAHREAFEVPGRVRFEQIFLSRSRRGDRLERDALELAARLRDAPDEIAASDATPLSFPGLVDEARLDALVGASFGAAVMRSPLGAWSAPIASPFGVHFVRVRELEARRTSTVDEARARAISVIREADRAAAFDREMVALRATYDVAIERRP